MFDQSEAGTHYISQGFPLLGTAAIFISLFLYRQNPCQLVFFLFCFIWVSSELVWSEHCSVIFGLADQSEAGTHYISPCFSQLGGAAILIFFQGRTLANFFFFLKFVVSHQLIVLVCQGGS